MATQRDQALLVLSALDKAVKSSLGSLLESLHFILDESQNAKEYGGGSDGSIDGNEWNQWKKICSQLEEGCFLLGARCDE